MTEGACLALEFHDLVVDGVGITGEENSLLYSLLSGDLDERRRVLGGGLDHRLFWLPQARHFFCITGLGDLGFAAIDLGGGLRRGGAGQEFRHLRSRLEARIEEPQDLATDSHSLLIGIADVDHRRVGEHVSRGWRQACLAPRQLVGIPSLLGTLRAAQYECVDDAAPPALGCRTRIARRCPQLGHRLLIGPRPDVHMTMREVLALPTERTLTMG